MISLVDRQISYDTLFLYYATIKECLWVKWKVRNLDLFPFPRFNRSLTTDVLRLGIPPSRLRIEFEIEKEDSNDRLHVNKFLQAKKLIQLHWLDGFPLWSCLTSLSDRQDYKDLFGDYTYSVRRIVALYRVDREAWKSHSIKYLHGCKAMDNDDSSTNEIEALSDADLVEAIINMLCVAMGCNLGYKGSYSRVGRDETEWDEDGFEVFNYKGLHIKIAHEKERAILHVASQYRKQFDKELKERLGEVYDECERLPEDARIPEGVIL
ncbi:hypothetical protein G6011_03435 [Alternaria panax]|uniref:Uncharacterized protein n=1 Tax=Alternaria panax TaxID=48097 RepID=A0AAD4IF69_9PLEO|nr:hypothetical protein G6011_03435 [Alternaria panax]